MHQLDGLIGFIHTLTATTVYPPGPGSWFYYTNIESENAGRFD